MPRAKLSDRKVKAIRAEKAQEDYWDELTPGLCLRVSGKTQRKTWLVRYRSNGKHRRMKLGEYPGTSLAEARDDARAALAKADRGEDPATERKEKRERAQTFEAMAAEVLEARSRKGRDGKPTRDKTRRERQRLLNRHVLPEWGGRDPATISRREVVLLTEEIARNTPVQANRVLSLVRLIYNDAIRRGFPGVEANPAHLVEPPGVEKGRDRYLTRDELPAVWKATEPEALLTRAAFRLAFLTAQRIGSILAMRHEDVVENGQGALWTIPEEHFKGRRPHLVPLSAEALEIVHELQEAKVDETWMFPSRAGTKHPHVTNLNGSLARIRKRSKLPHWTLHDARTTFRTFAVRAEEDGGLGVPAHVADAVLGHKEASLGFERYTGDRDTYLLHEKRGALQRWGAFVRRALEES